MSWQCEKVATGLMKGIGINNIFEHAHNRVIFNSMQFSIQEATELHQK